MKANARSEKKQQAPPELLEEVFELNNRSTSFEKPGNQAAISLPCGKLEAAATIFRQSSPKSTRSCKRGTRNGTLLWP